MEFNAKEEVNNIVSFIRKYYKQNNLGGVVIGISGGKDSAVVAAIFTKALGKENVIGVTMPCHSKDTDKKDAKAISDYYGFKLYDFDLTKMFDTFKEELKNIGFYNQSLFENSDINLKPRLRMSTLYYFSALFTALKKVPYLVAGTGNKCERYVGYFTKGGDGMSDINVIGNYLVSEVIKIGEYLKVPKEILYKTPSDGLSNLSDEDKLGVSYSDIEKYLEGNNNLNSALLIEKMHLASKHKDGIIYYERN